MNNSLQENIKLLGIGTILERLIFHTVYSILILYCIKYLRLTADSSYQTFSAFMALSYTTPILGGILADKIFGYSKSLVIGSTIILFASISCLLVPDNIFIGLALFTTGSGFFKSNITSLFSEVESKTQKDIFLYYFRMINVGAFLAPILCASVGEIFGWKYCFAILFLCSTACLYCSVKIHRGKITQQSTIHTNVVNWGLIALICIGVYNLIQHKSYLDSLMISALGIIIIAVSFHVYKNVSDLKALGIVAILLFFNTIFWSLFEQIGSTINIFTEKHIDRVIAGITIPTSLFQSLNSFFVIILTPTVEVFWRVLKLKKVTVSYYTKFALGLIIASLSYAIFIIFIDYSDQGQPLGIHWLILFYLFLTTGELLVAPVGLRLLSRLVPKRIKSTSMGIWQFSTAFSNWVIGILAINFVSENSGYLKAQGFIELFSNMLILGLASGAAMSIIFLFINKRDSSKKV